MMLKAKPRGAHVPSSIRASTAYHFWGHRARFQHMNPQEREAYLKRLEARDPRKAEAMRGLFERHL